MRDPANEGEPMHRRAPRGATFVTAPKASLAVARVAALAFFPQVIAHELLSARRERLAPVAPLCVKDAAARTGEGAR